MNTDEYKNGQTHRALPGFASGMAGAGKPVPVIPPADLAVFPKDHRFGFFHKGLSRRLSPAAVYPYHCDDFGYDGALCMCAVRYLRPDGTKDIRPWIWGKYDGEDDSAARFCMGNLPAEFPRPLYNLPELNIQLQRSAEPIVLVVEGEKCVESIYHRNASGVPARYQTIAELLFGGRDFAAVTWASGCASVRKTDWRPLAKAAHVIVWPDNDSGGMKAAFEIRKHLRGIRPGMAPATVLDFSGAGKVKGWDIADLFAETEAPAT
ncbi:MAG: hypothetical protein LBR80_12940 [Deltaproteobacteria bacterium]|nr:hypothetical protein [Deltaproteobacteria bacterium]